MARMNFARFPKWVLKPETFSGMKPVTVKVLACLADCLNSSDDRGKISVRVLGERCGLARRTVQIALADLAELGVIDRDQATGEYSFIPETGGAPQCAGAHGDAQGGAPACAGGRTTVREGAHERAQGVGRNKDSPRTSYQELSTKNNSQEGAPPPVLSEPEIDQQRVHRAIEILNDQTDTKGKPIWRPYTNKVRTLADQWVLHNHRDPEDLSPLIEYGLRKASGNPGAYIAKIIEAGDWEPDQPIPIDPERAAKIERLRKDREARKAAAQ